MKRRRWEILLFLILGGLSIVIGVISFIYKYEAAYKLAFEAAIILFTATLVETLLLKEFGNRAVETMERLGEKTQDSINIRLNATFDLLENARYNGIINILPPFLDVSKNQNKDERCLSAILLMRDALENTKKVKVFGISGRSFLWSHQKTGFYEIFLNKARNERDYEVQVLLTSGYGAKIRGKRDNPKNPHFMQDHVKISREEVEHLHTESKRELIKIKYYNFIPQAWFIITDDKMFFEPFHMANHTFLKDHWEEQFPDNIPWSGGRVPILVVQKSSFLYDAMGNYFDWLWKHDDPAIFNDEFKEYFNVEDDVATTDNKTA